MRLSIQLKTAAVSALATMLSGCLVGPNYRLPPVNSPVSFRGTDTSLQASIADLPWWEVFKDDTLKSLVQQALANNYNLKIAVTRIEQARQIAVEARSQLYPQLSYTAVPSACTNPFL